jgi:hypothetical protein
VHSRRNTLINLLIEPSSCRGRLSFLPVRKFSRGWSVFALYYAAARRARRPAWSL